MRINKKMKSLFVCVCLCITQVIFSQNLVSVNIDPTNTPKGKLMLSDLIESIEYIPLETKDNCLIGEVSFFDVSKNFILVYCRKTQTVYLYKRDGSFVRQIGNFGQGPGEYLGVYDIFIDENKNELILSTTGKHLFFNLSGKHLRTIDISKMHMYLWIYYNNQFLSGSPSGVYPGTFPVYTIWTLDMQQINSFIQSVPVEHKEIGGVAIKDRDGPLISKYMYKNKHYVRETDLNDTVYVVNNNNLTPKYILNTGKYGVTAVEKGIFDIDLFAKFAHVISVAETEAYILFRYKYKNAMNCAYYKKDSGKLEYFNTNEDGIPNNYDGGLDFWPKKQINNEWYCFHDAYDFQEKASKHKALSPIISQTSSQKFKNVVKKLDPDDNPVLVIAKIK